MRDAEWCIKRVDQTSDNNYLLSCDGLSELVNGREAYFLTNHYQKLIFRSAAASLLGQMVKNRDNTVVVDSLSIIPINHLLESALEERFIAELSKVGKLSRY